MRRTGRWIIIDPPVRRRGGAAPVQWDEVLAHFKDRITRRDVDAGEFRINVEAEFEAIKEFRERFPDLVITPDAHYMVP